MSVVKCPKVNCNCDDLVTEPQPHEHKSALHSPALPYCHTFLQTSRRMNINTAQTHSQHICQQADSQKHSNKQHTEEPGLSCEILSSAVIADMCLVTGING